MNLIILNFVARHGQPARVDNIVRESSMALFTLAIRVAIGHLLALLPHKSVAKLAIASATVAWQL